jgi:hypothetical protein
MQEECVSTQMKHTQSKCHYSENLSYDTYNLVYDHSVSEEYAPSFFRLDVPVQHHIPEGHSLEAQKFTFCF